jgi:hypothetical protein
LNKKKKEKEGERRGKGGKRREKEGKGGKRREKKEGDGNLLDYERLIWM